eukprot:scaffold1402_cov403-Prasinococcus_capsulatus_cf.AAC.10
MLIYMYGGIFAPAREEALSSAVCATRSPKGELAHTACAPGASPPRAPSALLGPVQLRLWAGCTFRRGCAYVFPMEAHRDARSPGGPTTGRWEWGTRATIWAADRDGRDTDAGRYDAC